MKSRKEVRRQKERKSDTFLRQLRRFVLTMLLLAAIQYLGPLLTPDRTVSLQRLVQAGLSAALVYWFLGRILRARSPRVVLDYESGEALEDLRDDLHDQTGQRQSIAMLINTIISSIDYMDLTISRELTTTRGKFMWIPESTYDQVNYAVNVLRVSAFHPRLIGRADLVRLFARSGCESGVLLEKPWSSADKLQAVLRARLQRPRRALEDSIPSA